MQGFIWNAGVPQLSLAKARDNTDPKFLSAVMRIIGDFVAEGDQPYDVELVNLGLIEIVMPILQLNNNALKREAI